MKKLTLLFLLISIFSLINIYSQNTFPSSGNVGIGTNSPGSLLNVGTKTTNSPSSIAQLGGNAPNSELNALSLVNSGGGTDQSTGISFHNRSNWSPTGKIVVKQNGTSTTSKLHFYTYNGGLNNRLTIDENGNAGIGTTSPTKKIHVEGEFLFKEVNRLGVFESTSISSNFDIKNSEGSSKIGRINNLFFINDGTGDFYDFVVMNDNVGIGTTTPDSKLSVNGTIHSKKVKVDMVGWSDFVFKNTYNLPTLEEVEKHIQENGHLQDIPSTHEVIENGIYLGEMDAKLLQKIEELTLYTIEQEKKIAKLENLVEQIINDKK